jgi:adenosylcobinamide-GDP ribazoletransferase
MVEGREEHTPALPERTVQATLATDVTPQPSLPEKEAWPQSLLHSFLLSASFLTSIPIPLSPGAVSGGTIAGALRFFPVIGAIIGALAGFADFLLRFVLPPVPVAVIDLALLALLSGGLHLDALMDTADGIFGGLTVEQRLTIMKDSRIGSFGAIAGILILLVEFTAITALPDNNRWLAFIAAGACSRWSMLLSIAIFPSARPTGLGASFRSAAKREPIVTGSIMLAGLLLPLLWLGLVLVIVSCLVVLTTGAYLTRQLKGLTGDSYGAIGELSTAVSLLALSALFR